MENHDTASIKRLVTQRDQAVVCAALAILISITLVLSTFLGHRNALVTANAQIVTLQDLLLKNQDALLQTEKALLNAEKAQAPGGAQASTTPSPSK
jgi:hypothetical protein